MVAGDINLSDLDISVEDHQKNQEYHKHKSSRLLDHYQLLKENDETGCETTKGFFYTNLFFQ